MDMLHEMKQDQVPFEKNFHNVRFCNVYIVNQTIQVLARGIVPNIDIFSTTLSGLIQKRLVQMNGYSL